ncbi:helix-turn-helix domain-containing protein [Streptomyces acidiscabies]|uniref:helix-turn-helix domain-containing protein n=1 Tax=Streptomyces acidiscabies TaxID=42234 RepID=UPI0009604BAD|nr:helix-turn-helix domain-containing protein [Streptomyces acidiscabies]GAV38277.1 nucleoid-associated protein EspR [Streptomyces acidiscabies]
MTSADKRSGRVARGLQSVIQEVRSPSGRPYTNAQIAAGSGLSEAAVAALRSGDRPNPTINTIEALARFFGVPEERLMPAAQGAPESELSAVLADADVRNIAMRSAGLSAGSLEMIKAVVARARELEGLDSPDESPGGSSRNRP